MRSRVIAFLLGQLLMVLLAFGLAPLVADLLGHRPVWPWVTMELLILAAAMVLRLAGRGAQAGQLRIREGIALTTLAWIAFSLLAGVGITLAARQVGPFYLKTTFIEGWFEAMSGFTTTGGSVFGGDRPIADLSPGVLLWRALTHWMGGIGIVVMTIAVLPSLGGGSGFQLYRAEVSGIDKGRVTPRIRDTARLLAGLYLGLSAVLFLALLVCGVSIFDAFCHMAATVATGGFSNYDDSVEGLRSVAAEWVLAGGMLASGFNFAVILTSLRTGPRELWRSEELRFYLILLGAASFILILITWLQVPEYAGRRHDLIRDCIFQVISIATTTGFSSGFDVVPAGWDAWPAMARLILILLMVGGGCAGSTTGGLKLVRLLVAVKSIRRLLYRFVEPARVIPVRLDGRPLSDPVLLQVGSFVVLYFLVWMVGTLLLACCAPSGAKGLEEPASAALACLSNVGPGLGSVGAAGNFGKLGGPAQGVCILLMLLGRLELLGVLVLLAPRPWLRPTG